jgi:hypothetical protein
MYFIVCKMAAPMPMMAVIIVSGSTMFAVRKVDGLKSIRFRCRESNVEFGKRAKEVAE